MSSYPLYSDKAELWPLVAPLSSYEDEMWEWTEHITGHFQNRPLTVLDLGTGGGHHLYHLLEQLDGLTGGLAVDLSPEMLAQTQQLLPQVETRVGDMTTVNLAREFPLVTVHDSFCYLTSLEQVESLFGNIKRHLEPGGLALVKVDAVRDTFHWPYRYLTDFEDEEQEITLTHYEWDPDPNDHRLEVIYLFLLRREGQVTCWEERHQLGLLAKEEILQAARSQGLKPRFHQLERWDEERENLLLLLEEQDD